MNRDNNIDELYESVEYQERYVAFLDMLGFSNKCANAQFFLRFSMKIVTIVIYCKNCPILFIDKLL